ncbi:hypothetical protein D0Y65_036676 [Glycine soja]|uniref:Uncharacterized protein n=1 Tax=Glycine soja TaxID=3848 RepID=A0A445HG16_GLYSO|nr:hypothetical protein glysoja_007941 [Glycine soja]RZB72526.1 hypothetical protein D0Y65_036676 [Glycine soja]
MTCFFSFSGRNLHFNNGIILGFFYFCPTMSREPLDEAKDSIGSAPTLQRKGKIQDPHPRPFKNQIHAEKRTLGLTLTPTDVFVVATPTHC